MKRGKFVLSAVVASAAFLGGSAWALPTTPVLGSAEDYAILAHTGVTNTGTTVVGSGAASPLANVGVYEAGANAISGFSLAGNTFYGPGTFTDGAGIVTAPAAIHGGDGPALNARNDLFTAFTALSLLPATHNLTGQDLGNFNTSDLGALVPGVYHFDSSAGMAAAGSLQLNAGGINGVYWVFQIGTDLTTGSASSVTLINPGSNNGSDVGVFWVLGTSLTGGLGSATLGSTTAFEGNILALTSISLDAGATIYNGRALAENGAVTLISNVIDDFCPNNNNGPGFSGGLGFNAQGELVPVPVIPEPCTLLLVGSGLVSLLASRKRLWAGRCRSKA